MTDNYRDVAADFLAPVRHFYLVEEEYEAHLTAATKRLKQLARGWRREGTLLKDVFGTRDVCHNTLNLERKDEDS